MPSQKAPGVRNKVWLVLAAAVVVFGAGAVARDLIGRLNVKETVAAMFGGEDAAPAAEPVTEIRTALHTLLVSEQAFPDFVGQGGAIEQIGDVIIVGGPEGQLFTYKPGETPRELAAKIPVNLEQLRQDEEKIGWAVMRDGGLRVLDLLAAPRAAGGYDLLASYQFYTGTCIEFRVSAIGLSPGADGVTLDSAGWRTLFKGSPCLDMKAAAPSPNVEGMCVCVGGGRMVLTGDRRILFGVGDHEFDGRGGRPRLAQDPSSTLGKMITLDLDTGAYEIYASGFRNPQGLAKAADGRIWETEHGPRGGDELNLIVHGANYGWPDVTLGTQYNWSDSLNRYAPWPGESAEARHEGYQKPFMAFVPSIATSNLVEVTGDEFPRWKGDLLIASLAGQKLMRIRLEGASILYAEPIEIGARVRDILVLSDGRIALWTDSHILKILSDFGPDARQAPELSPLAAQGQQMFNRACANCHDLFGATGSGPSLRDLMNRDIASQRGYTYSPALSRAPGHWDKKQLQAFLAAPQKAVPGTSMPAIQMKTEEIDSLIAYFEAQ